MRGIRYRVLKVLLLLGALFGFAAGFASMAFRFHRHHEMRRGYFERHVADVCLEAAGRRRAESSLESRSPRSTDWGHGPWQPHAPWQQHAPYWSAPPPPLAPPAALPPAAPPAAAPPATPTGP